MCYGHFLADVCSVGNENGTVSNESLQTVVDGCPSLDDAEQDDEGEKNPFTDDPAVVLWRRLQLTCYLRWVMVWEYLVQNGCGSNGY